MENLDDIEVVEEPAKDWRKIYLSLNLNPNWKKVYDPKDFDEWERMEATTPPFFEHSFATINKLLKKYFRTKSGYELGPTKSWYQRKEILAKTMNRLREAVWRDEEESSKRWHAQREKEESLDAKLEREKAMYEAEKESSLKKGPIMNRISKRDKVAEQKPIITPPKKSRDQYDQSELAKGLKVEMEHTTDENLAANIAMNHLDESADYYKHLEKMESKF